MISALRYFAERNLTRQILRNILLVYLLFIMLVNVLRDSVQGVENSLMMLMITTGLLLGWALAVSKTDNWKTAVIAVLSGGTILMIRVGRLGSLIFSLFAQIWNLGTQTWVYLFNEGDLPRSTEVPLGIAELGSRVLTLGTRLGVWIQSLLRGNPIFDPVATAFIWGIFIWVISVWAMWITIRHKKPLWGIIPTLVLTSLSLVYTGTSVYNLIPMLGITIGLIVMGRYDSYEEGWISERVEFAGIIRERMIFFSVVMAVSLMAFAAISPSITVRSIVDFIDRITSDNIDEDDLVRSLGLEPSGRDGNVSVLDSRQSGGLPNRHLIGSGEELGDQIVMIIQVQELSEVVLEDIDPGEQLYYWRGLTYDQYVGRGWVSRDSIDREYKPGELILSDWPDTFQIVRQRVEFVEDLNGLLFSAGIPLSTDQDFEVAWRVQNTNDVTFDIFGARINAEVYTADSLQPQASQIELQAAEQDYPQWILNRYLGLPESVPDRVIGLARDITATEATPYDRALALEAFLRRFPYTLDLPQPPQDRDITDYFLFSAQRGYCDYYATAMVVLARAAGLPARLVTGYIGGYYDETLDAYLVTADLAHAWPEIYFPEYGWIIFEPTGGRPEVDRPDSPVPKLNPDYISSFDPLVPGREALQVNWWILSLGIIAGLVSLGFLVYYLDILYLKRLHSRKQLDRIYRRIFRYSRWMGLNSKPGDTPWKFSGNLIKMIYRYGKGSKEAEWLLYGSDLLREITRNYYQVLYSSNQNLAIESQELIDLYRELHKRLWYLLILVKAYPYRITRYFLWDNAPMIVRSGSTQS
jgi:transglutaminase-like putative cysteine protease